MGRSLGRSLAPIDTKINEYLEKWNLSKTTVFTMFKFKHIQPLPGHSMGNSLGHSLGQMSVPVSVPLSVPGMCLKHSKNCGFREIPFFQILVSMGASERPVSVPLSVPEGLYVLKT